MLGSSIKKGAEAPLANQASAPAPPFERVEDVVKEKTSDTIVTYIIMITDYIVGPKTLQQGQTVMARTPQTISKKSN